MQRYNANLPSVGLATFMKSPVCEDLSKIDADVAILGIPYDGGTGFRPGAVGRLGQYRSPSTATARPQYSTISPNHLHAQIYRFGMPSDDCLPTGMPSIAAGTRAQPDFRAGYGW